MKLVPIQPDSPQDHLAKTVATVLTIQGVEDTVALPVALDLLALIQDAQDKGVKEAVEKRIKDDRRAAETAARHRLPIISKHYTRMANSLEMLLGEITSSTSASDSSGGSDRPA